MALVTTAYDERVIIPFRRQAPIPLRYDDLEFACVFKADFIVAGELIVEIKAVERLLDLHFAQVLTYLRCSGLKKGLLLNFNATRLVVRSVVLS